MCNLQTGHFKKPAPEDETEDRCCKLITGDTGHENFKLWKGKKKTL
jgi:hypothetical protein